MISSIVFINTKGEILIYRVYKDDITYYLKLVNLHKKLVEQKQFSFAPEWQQQKNIKKAQLIILTALPFFM